VLISVKQYGCQSAKIKHFGGLNANISDTVKDMDCKFDKPVPRDSPEMTPNYVGKREETVYSSILINLKLQVVAITVRII